MDNYLVGMLFALLAFFLLAAMNMIAKLLSVNHSVLEISFYRNLIAVMPFLFVVFGMGRRDILNVKGDVKLLIFRSVLGTVSLAVTFAAYAAMPMADTKLHNLIEMAATGEAAARAALLDHACERLAKLPAYLEQLEMESNGKSADRDGRAVDYATAPVLWGATGTVGQHAFFQALHQGTQPVPADFIGVARPMSRYQDLHEQLMANLFAQTEALMRGQTADEARAQMAEEGLVAEQIDALLPFRIFPGNRPSTTILLRELSPPLLGMLIALYEHKVFTQSVIWRVNAFDQWGVELGKRLAEGLLPALRDGEGLEAHDASTRGLVAQYRAWRSEA